MVRYKQINNERMPLTPEEEAEQDAQAVAHDPDADKWKEHRRKRNKLLRETDHWAFVDAAQIMSDAMKDYRKSLRDIPQDYANPEDVVFPIKPNEK